MSGANLNSADLQDADLEGANLQDADLAYAEFQGASLKNTVLTGAKIWTEERLRSAASLEGATMPDGRTLRGDETPEGPTFEIRVKDKKAAKEDRGNE